MIDLMLQLILCKFTELRVNYRAEIIYHTREDQRGKLYLYTSTHSKYSLIF